VSLIVRAGLRTLSISEEIVSPYIPLGWVRTERPSDFSPAGLIASRASVELVVPLGGMTIRALIGGSYTPGTGTTLLKVGYTANLAVESDRPYLSELGSHLLVGMPQEFAGPALIGLGSEQSKADYSGVYRVSSGAYDPVGSGALVFEHVARLLRYVLDEFAIGSRLDQLDEDLLKETLGVASIPSRAPQPR
jgi:hypothetical protein